MIVYQVSKKTGMEKERLLDDEGKEADKGIWDTISRYNILYIYLNPLYTE